MSGEDSPIPVGRVAGILRFPSTQTLWGMIHAGVMEAVWDKGAHAVPRASLIGYLESAMTAATRETAACAEPIEDSPFAYCKAAVHVRAKITGGELRPGDKVLLRAVAAETGYGHKTVRKGLGVLVEHGDLRYYGHGWVVSPHEQ